MTTKTEWTGPEFAPIFYRSMAEWYEGGCVGLPPEVECKRNRRDLWVRHTTNDLTTGFCCSCTYRWKPAPKRTVTIGYFDATDMCHDKTLDATDMCHDKTLVAPEVEAPEDGTQVWVEFADSISPFSYYSGIVSCKKWLDQRKIFLTREDAQAMADWLATCRSGKVL